MSDDSGTPPESACNFSSGPFRVVERGVLGGFYGPCSRCFDGKDVPADREVVVSRNREGRKYHLEASEVRDETADEQEPEGGPKQSPLTEFVPDG